MQEEILTHLKEKYNPDVIILHGSRARGKERPHSDWDFIFLYSNSESLVNGRELYKEQNIEFTSHILPVALEDIESEFSTKLQGAKVLYEQNGKGTALLKEAEALYQKGVYWSPERTENHKLWMQGRIDGMKDNIDDPLFFFKYATDFYQRVFNYWYWVSQNAFPQPIYVAEEETRDRDPEYLELVQQFADMDTSPEEKVAIAEKIRDRLFK